MSEAEIRSGYEDLYHRLKANTVGLIEGRRGLPPSDAEEIVRIVSLLPHPKVASIQDIAEVCRQCTSGKLEYFYQYFGSEAGAILRGIEKEYPVWVHDKTLLDKPLPPPPTVTLKPVEPAMRAVEPVRQIIEPEQLKMYLEWNSRALYKAVSLGESVKSISDITIKGQCPYCQRDLVAAVVDNELRLRCKSRTTPQCDNIDWYVGAVSKRRRP